MSWFLSALKVCNLKVIFLFQVYSSLCWEKLVKSRKCATVLPLLNSSCIVSNRCSMIFFFKIGTVSQIFNTSVCRVPGFSNILQGHYCRKFRALIFLSLKFLFSYSSTGNRVLLQMTLLQTCINISELLSCIQIASHIITFWCINYIIKCFSLQTETVKD